MATFAFFQHAATGPSLRGWVEGLEARGHRAIVVAALPARPHEDWSGMEVVVLPDAAWTRAIPRRLRAGRAKHVLTMPDPRAVRRLLLERHVDVVVVKVYSLRNAVVAAVAAALRLRRLAWVEQVPPLGPEWRLLRALGILPRRLFTTVADRPGGASRPDGEQAARIPVVSYAPPAGPDRHPTTDRSHGVRDRPLRFLTVAAWKNGAAKRQWHVLEAAASAGLLDGRATFTFVGVGGPRDEAYRRVDGLARELAAAHLVELRCDVPAAEIPAVMDAHDVLLLPSVQEQFGMVVPEAMARGLPVVTTTAVGAVGLVDPGGTGLVVAPEDIAALGSALRRLVEDPGLAVRMGEAGRARAAAWASPQHSGGALERLAGG